MLLQLAYLLGNPIILLNLGFAMKMYCLCGSSFIGAQVFLYASLVVGNNGIGNIQNIGNRSVILVEDYICFCREV